MTHIEQRFYGTVTKKDLLWKANMVMERFNNANFKTKRIKTILVFQILL